MMNTLKNPFKVQPLTVVRGKWHNNTYTIIRELGSGANGVVYLARWNHRDVAIKFSNDGMSITSEVNVLKAFAKVQGAPLGPCLLDVDDWVVNQNKIVSFYVMEYIKGEDFLTFIRKRGNDWIGILISQLLKDLHNLHQNGWAFGDLKPENLLVVDSPPRVRCIDVGGTTVFGRAIKEYTEFYDRGYWGIGSRRAEATYDLFAVAMIMINTQYPKRFLKTTGGIGELKQKIKENPFLLKYEDVLIQALEGKFQSALEMRRSLLKSIHFDHKKSTGGTKHGHYNLTPQPSSGKKKDKKRGRKLETFLIMTVISFLYMWYIVEYLL